MTTLFGPLRAYGGDGDARAARAHAERLRSVTVDARRCSDIVMFGSGALAPLTGFLDRRDYRSVVHEMRLHDGSPWTIPITLPVPADLDLRCGEEVALRDSAGQVRGTLYVDDVYDVDPEREAQLVYGTTDAAHPGVAVLYGQSRRMAGGPVHAFTAPLHGPYDLTPAETRAAFAERGWCTVVGFQTRNPVHRAHEYIQKCALEMVDGLLLHPLVGETKAGDVSADVRMRCYEALLERYYPAERVILSTLPAAMRYAGPREAIFHALIRKNYGCTHFIVGRDHAGVGSYYGSFDAQRMFDQFAPGELGIVPLKFENAFFCRTCDAMASAKTCPHGSADHISLSGSAVRAMLHAGTRPPSEFSRPEVADILIEATRDGSL